MFADGPAIVFAFKACHHPCDDLEGIDEVRNSIPWICMSAGDLHELRAADWAREIATWCVASVPVTGAWPSTR